MLFVDDVVFAPMKGILSIFKEIHKAAAQEMADEADSIRAELARLYQRLESGEISDQQFDDVERDLLDRLDLIEAREATFGTDEDEDEESDEDELDDDGSDDEESDDEGSDDDD